MCLQVAKSAVTPGLVLCASSACYHAGVDGEKWRMGRIEVLQPEDEEPFILASVKSGQTRTSVDTYMYKAGVSRRYSSAAVIIAVCIPWLSARGGLERAVSALLVQTACSQIRVHGRMP